MKFKNTIAIATALLALASAQPASAALKVVTTTSDLGALAKEVGGDKVQVDSFAKGYQDPHFVEPKPSFILLANKADLLIVVGRELEIGWLQPIITSRRNTKIKTSEAGNIDSS